ncbi:leucine-rich repeat receptor protein kinase HPCA1 [Rosa chinensis]|uniref:leucine-rich repeat receptor protein kinase HPCA1 n=1 Tax=Rosa chinensis TaxID=74649 RepID=UPI001AD92519|nr:leucine-rich repeat receptor protein kinase HPCA1 [Rosa chinensis]
MANEMANKVLMLIACKVMGRTLATHVFMLLVLTKFVGIAAEANNMDYISLKILMQAWDISWVGSDPCDGWKGIDCTNARVTSIILAGMGLRGQLPSDIQLLSELETLDLSLNKDLTGPIPTSIGNLKKLVNLNLAGCSFSEPIPHTIGTLKNLYYLDLNNNRLSGQIPPSIGALSNLFYLDLTSNKLQGYIPVSSEVTPGLDMLHKAQHFHLGDNQLSGEIPTQLFSSKMVLVHLLLDRNNLTGEIPSTLGLVQTLVTVRLDWNSLSGLVPSSLNNLSNMTVLYLSNNQLIGPVPNLTGMNPLNYVDMSNNTFDVSEVPDWFSTLQFLTTLIMENTRLQGQVPQALFGFYNLQTVVLRNNSLNGFLDIETNYGNQLRLIDLENNSITNLTQSGESNYTLILVGNPICNQTNMAKNYCIVSSSDSLYSTPPNNCAPIGCSSGKVSSPNCKCAHPYTVTLVFLYVSFSDFGNSTYYTELEISLIQSFRTYNIPVDSVSLGSPFFDLFYNFHLILEVFPSDQDHFNKSEASALASVLSNQTLPRPPYFGPFSVALNYAHFGGSNKALIIGAAVGCSVLLLSIALVGVYALQRKRRANDQRSRAPLHAWISKSSLPQLKGARLFSFKELKDCTNSFSEANDIGSGGYGNVYQGVLPTGEMVAIKRAKRESILEGIEFKAEVELLSRVHHKNLVSLVGFCLEQDEQMLVYEYVPNGNLMDSLSGKSGFRLNWMRRLKVALGAARGLAYLHEHATPSIIHRDVKPNNILLDKDLNAKVADFGLSKSMAGSGRDHVTTQVKGTMGYLDPEYYMTQQLTEKSDVYSFGVVMLELITARRPIERGRYIVRVVQMTMDRKKDLYNLQEILDPAIGLVTQLKGLEMFVDLAMSCVKELRARRPRMGEVVKEIENIIQIASLNAGANSASTSAGYEDVSKDSSEDPYSGHVLDHSRVFNLQR